MTRKYLGLDAIRGLAALMVLMHHTPDFWIYWPARAYLAVDVFFLLSGFVIAHSYEERLASGRLSGRRFVAMRIVRLYPLYALTLTLALGSLAVKLPWPSGESARIFLDQLVRGAFMIPTLSGPALFPRNSVFWSLYFELVVNLLYVGVRPLLGERLLRGIVIVSALCVVGLAAVTGGNTLGGQGSLLDWCGGLARAGFGIFTGVWLYRHRAALWSWAPPRVTLLAVLPALLLILGSGRAGRVDGWLDSVAVTIVFPCLVVCATRREPRSGHRWMTALGLASYPIYLLHPIASGVALRAAPRGIADHPEVAGWLFAGAMLALALVVDKVFDRPVRRALARVMLGRPGPSVGA